MFNDKKEELSILVYISTTKISASFVLFSKESNPKVIHSVTSLFPLGLKLDDLTLSNRMLSLLDITLLNLLSEAPKIQSIKNKYKSVNSVFVTFSAPWFTSKIKDIHLEQKDTFVITEDFLKNILQVEEKNFESELNNPEYDKKFSDGFSIIENTFTHSKVNGYNIPDNIGKKTNNFDISLYTSFITKEVYEGVISTIHKHTHLSSGRIFMNTFPLAFFYTIKNMFVSSNSFLFMNVEGEVTDMTLVHDGGISSNISFPSAKNFIVRQIAKDFDVSLEIAESMLHLYNSEKMDSEVSEKMKKSLSDVEKEWSIYFEDSLVHLSKSAILPAVIYMIAEPDVAILYKYFLNLSKSDATAMLRKSLNIVHINNDSFASFCNFEITVKKDEYVAMQSIFHNKIRLGFFTH